MAKEGYPLESEALAAMVKNQQFSYLKAYGGGEGLTKVLDGNPTVGLSSSFDYEKQREKFGRNFIDPPKVIPYYILIWEGLHDVTIIMLIASAIVSLVLGLAGGHSEGGGGEEGGGHSEESNVEWIEGVAILCTVVFVLNIQAFTDWSKAKEFREQQLELENAKAVHAIRDGKDQVIHPRELVVGDLIRVAVGDILAVDAVLLHGSDVKMDESALTGESTLIPKIPADDEPTSKDESPFLLSGTNVMSGSGKALVVAVGSHSLQGKILEEVSKQQEEVTTALEHPDEAKQEKEQSTNPFVRCCAGCGRGIKAFFTFGNIDTGGNLVEKLNSLAIDIGKLGVIVATIAFLVMVIRWSVQEFANDPSREWRQPQDLQTLLEFFVTAVTILVVAIPEGLPLAVTLSLAISMRRMMKDNNQVKHMDSCETMGSATTICSDKTGTLTQNRMTVMRTYVGNKVYVYDTDSHKSVGEVLKNSNEASKEFLEVFTHAIALNSSSTSTVRQDENGDWQYTGNATECALLKLVYQLGEDVEAIRKDPRFSDPKDNLDWGVHAIPFSSSKKRMSWIVPHPSGTGFRLYTKGAPSYIFDSCINSLDLDGTTIKDFDSAAKQSCDEKVSDFQDHAMRTIAIAYRDFESVPENGWDAPEVLEVAEGESPIDGSGMLEVETKLTLLGVVGIEDPLRPTVVDAIKRCNSAGVDVRMCTGDALATAIAISKQCGILRPRDLETNKDGKTVPKPNFAMTGAEFDERVHFLDTKKPKIKRRCFMQDTKEVGEMLQHPFVVDENKNKVINQKEFDIIWPKLRVLARCQPEDKLTLVRGLRNSELFKDTARCAYLKKEYGIEIFPDYQVVAVTGDGTNDAPALKNADVGFAMGIVGTDISKQACDIILLDDNFASIVQAAKWGRNVYDSISKFIQFQLTVNIVAIVVAVIGAFVFTASPLSAVQMLWVNLIMDSLASVSLATEPPTMSLLERKPYGKRRPIISRVMTFNMFGQAIYQLIIMLVILFADPAWIPDMTSEDKYPGDHKGTTVPSDHWTFLFNTFVQMQLFNQMNSRKLQTVDRLKETWDEWNVFSGITKNPIFLGVLLVEAGVQAIIVQFAGYAFRVTSLTGAQWGVCIGFGAFSLVWQFVINVALVATDKYVTPMSVVVAETTKAVDSGKPLDLEKGEQESRAQYHWGVVRNNFLTGKTPKSGVAADREDSWVLRGNARPFHDYDNTKLNQIQAERQVSETARDLLGIGTVDAGRKQE